MKVDFYKVKVQNDALDGKLKVNPSGFIILTWKLSRKFILLGTVYEHGKIEELKSLTLTLPYISLVKDQC